MAGPSPKVLAALSGGVDSSVAAALVRDSGRTVVGVTLLMGGGDARAARAAADALGIEHVVVDAHEAFARRVVEPSRRARRAGLTPNPCVPCNERVKIGALLDLAGDLDAGLVVTGHYARVRGRTLMRGRDRDKDQSYMLFTLAGDRRLGRVDFPLGSLTKDRVRELARRLGLPNTDRPESQDLCFELRDAALERPGPIVDERGVRLGTHDGLGRYTVGQHRGVRVPGSDRLFVLALRPARNEVVVGPASALAFSTVRSTLEAWDGPPPVEPADVTARIRYRQRDLPATAVARDGTLVVTFRQARAAAAPGQALVCYEGERVKGGGWILSATSRP